MASQIRSIAQVCRSLGEKMRNLKFSGTKGVLFRVATLVLAICANVYFVLEGAPPPYLAYVAVFFFLLATVLVGAISAARNAGLLRAARYLWKNPICFAFIAITILVPGFLSIMSMFHASHIAANVVSPEATQPWKQELTVRVWWQKTPSLEMQSGLADTARILGFTYEPAQSIHDANLRVWIDSWAYNCKWLTPYAFAAPDPRPSGCGSQTGDIHVCWFKSPFAGRKFSERSVIAHETAHILAAQPHFGDGLIPKGRGEYATWFTGEELDKMRSRISAFRTEVSPRCSAATGQHRGIEEQPQR